MDLPAAFREANADHPENQRPQHGDFRHEKYSGCVYGFGKELRLSEKERGRADCPTAASVEKATQSLQSWPWSAWKRRRRFQPIDAGARLCEMLAPPRQRGFRRCLRRCAEIKLPRRRRALTRRHLGRLEESCSHPCSVTANRIAALASRYRLCVRLRRGELPKGCRVHWRAKDGFQGALPTQNRIHAHPSRQNVSTFLSHYANPQSKVFTLLHVHTAAVNSPARRM